MSARYAYGYVRVSTDKQEELLRIRKRNYYGNTLPKTILSF